jgi:hypothetical protein
MGSTSPGAKVLPWNGFAQGRFHLELTGKTDLALFRNATAVKTGRNKTDSTPVRDVRNPNMKTNHQAENKTTGPIAKRCRRFPEGIGKLALTSSVLGVAIACGTGCSATGGFKTQLVVPTVQSAQSVDPADDGWYHPPESPGRGQG